MKGILPHSIPLDGERYDLTLKRIYQHEKTPTAKFYIDSGEYKGKDVSCYINDQLMILIQDKVSRIDDSVPPGWDDPAYYLHVNRFARMVRLSGIVLVRRQAAPNETWIDVTPEYQESNVKVTYDIIDFAQPTNAKSDTDRIFTNDRSS